MEEKDNNSDEIEFTSTEILNQMRVDSNVDIVGYVDSLDSVKCVGDNKQILKFLINNGDRVTIQVNAWNDEIPRIEKEIAVYQIIHLENIKAKKATIYNTGNFTGAELTVQKYTIIENLGKIDRKRLESLKAKNEDDGNIKTIDLDEISLTLLPKKFRTVGYLKTNISSEGSRNEDSMKKAYCVITDGKYKLDVTINNYVEENGLQKGDHVEVIGKPFFINNRTNLNVKSITDLKKIDDEKKPVNWLLKGVMPIEKEENLNQTNKKQKVN